MEDPHSSSTISVENDMESAPEIEQVLAICDDSKKANEVDNEQKNVQHRRLNKKRVLIFLGIVTLITAITLSAVLTLNNNEQCDFGAKVLELSSDQGKALTQEGTPQYQALEWVLSGSFSEHNPCADKMVEIYAAATLYFAAAKPEGTVVYKGDLYNPRCYRQTVPLECAINDQALNLGSNRYGVPGPNISALPPEIGLLTSLTSLIIEDAILQGTLPSELGLLTKLQELSLSSGNREDNCRLGYGPCLVLTSTIPSEIGGLTDLKSLNLADHSFSGIVPTELGRLRNLETLHLERNCLTGILPNEMTQFENLTTVVIQQNALSGFGPGFAMELADQVPDNWRTLVAPYIDSNICDCDRSDRSDVSIFSSSIDSPKVPPLCTRAPAGMCTHLLDSHPDCDFIRRPPLDDNDLKPFEPPSGCETSTPEGIEAFRRTLIQLSPSLQTELLNSSTPQGEAFDWMVANDTLSCFSPTSQVQRFILSALYFGIKDPAYSDHVIGWLNSSASECDWGGIECLHTGEVGRLEFSSPHGLTYMIPPEVGLLTRLRRIVSFRGGGNFGYLPELPSELGNLSELTSLRLRLTIGGTLPVEWSALTNLRELKVDTSGMHGSIPSEFGSLSRLEVLDLSEVQMSGTLPSELGALSKLEELRLRGGYSDKGLEGIFPTILFALPNLRVLELARHQFASSLPTEVGLARNLQMLWFSKTQMIGPIPTEIGLARNLETLSLTQNQFIGTLPTQLGQLSNLEYLWVSQGDYRLPNRTREEHVLSGSLPSELGQLSSLSHLDVGFQDFSGTVPIEWSGMQSLEYLILKGNPRITGVLPNLQISTLKTVYSELTSMNYTCTSNSYSGCGHGHCQQKYNYTSRCYSFYCWKEAFFCREN